MRIVAAVALIALSPAAFAGAQQYEPLADSVRQRLSTLVSDRAPAAIHFKSSWSSIILVSNQILPNKLTKRKKGFRI